MFRLFVCFNLIFVHVFCQTTEDTWQLTTDFDTTIQFEQQTITEEDLEKSTQIWQNITDENTFEQDNFTDTTTSTSTSTTTDLSYPSLNITTEFLDKMKKDIIDAIIANLSSEINSQLEAMEERLSSLIRSNANPGKPVVLSWQIYENLQIPLTGWLCVFDQPYSHKTRIDDLNQTAGICHNEVLIGATYNGSITIAAVGPSSILNFTTVWNQPQPFGQVYWYRSPGKSFGFSPNPTIRQTYGDNEDLSSTLRLSWILDQNTGGYRAGTTRVLTDDPLWHKVIYCN